MTEQMQIAFQHHQAGRLADAEKIYRQVLSQNPHQPDALHLLGLIAYRTGHADVACDLISRAVRLLPSMPEYQNNLSVVLESLGRFDDALAAARQAVELQPNSAGPWYNLANALRRKRRLDEAMNAYQRSLALDPTQIDARGNLATTLKLLGRRKEAIAEFQAVVAAAPGDVKALNNLGDALRDDGQIEQAIAIQQQAIALDPKNSGAHNNLGAALVRRALSTDPARLFDEAIDEFHQAILCDPRNSESRLNLGMTYLLQGDFERGWQYYEGREAINSSQRPMTSAPHWDGCDISGKTILLYHEQGLGDTIQFIRYAPLVARRGANVIVACPRALLRLLQCVPNVRQFLAAGDPIPPHDFRCRLTSLPFIFQTRIDTIPAEKSYLAPDWQLVEQWKSRLPQDARKKIGLVWAGNPSHANDHNRSLSLSDFAPLAEVRESVQFFTLQKGPPAIQTQSAPPNVSLLDFTADLHDFADTAALISQFDLVIAADTAVAHLSAAMGRPTWLLVGNVPDWRWMLGRTDSPWYPTMRLFRQPPSAGWDIPIQQIRLALRADFGS